MDDIDFFQRLGGGLVVFGIYEACKGHYIVGPLTALTGAGITYVEYRIDVARTKHREDRRFIDSLNLHPRN